MLNPAFSKKWTSQHHRNPLIFSGFFVSDTVLDTLADKQHYTQISFLRCCGCVFVVTSLHYKRLHDNYEEEEYMTPENKKVRFSEVLVFPKGVVPENGVMQIRLKEKVYSFNLDHK